ncbi:SDR family oxidoreductase [Patescibacteria group bacterium]|nr:SDR family oxidoreductase [Patescibacteria group bacterium]
MNDIFSIRGKVIIVTGGNGFLGKQWVEHLCSCGAVVIVFDTHHETPVDITDPAALREAVKSVVQEHGRIDGLIHSAAADAVPGSPESAQQFSPYEQFPLDLWEKELKLNLTASHVVTQYVVPEMMRSQRGSIVFVASELALIAPQNNIYDSGKFKDIAYVASKAGVLGLMRSWASYLGPYGVRANALVPGGMHRDHPLEFAKKYSELNMLGRMAQEGEYNGAINFLLSDASSYMTGSSFVIDGGRTAW